MSLEKKEIKILLIDDDRFLLDMYSLKFKNGGLTADTCSSSREALSRLREGAVYDIIILDIIMPSMDGLELLEIIRQEKLAPKSIIIMLTNQADEIEKARLLGIDGYIVKAMNIPSEVVKQVLDIYNTKHSS